MFRTQAEIASSSKDAYQTGADERTADLERLSKSLDNTTGRLDKLIDAIVENTDVLLSQGISGLGTM